MKDPTLHAGGGRTVLAGPVALLIGGLAIGYAPIGLRLSEFGPQATAVWRFALALPVLALLARAQGGIGRPTLAALLAGAFFGADIAFWHAALTRTSVANATFIVNLGSVLAGLVAWLVLRQRPSRIWPLAALLALAGAWMLSRNGGGGEEALSGDLLALAAAGLVSLYVVMAALARQTSPPWSVMFWSTSAALAVAVTATAIGEETLVPGDWTWLLAPASLAVVAHLLGQGMIMIGLGRTPAAIAGLILLVQPVAGAAIAWPLFGEGLGGLQLAGCGLILCGVWLSSRVDAAPGRT